MKIIIMKSKCASYLQWYAYTYSNLYILHPFLEIVDLAVKENDLWTLNEIFEVINMLSSCQRVFIEYVKMRQYVTTFLANTFGKLNSVQLVLQQYGFQWLLLIIRLPFQ